ncbi:YitT family protein [Ectothiorhodospiraceae bacterium WFHF3C12]|nr:YitT family protein [Ectothiorhodospiraceae bacterium WFHF3C12]
MASTSGQPSAAVVPHSLFEDAQALLVAPLLVAFAVLLFQHAELLTGGTVGIAFLVHYLADWPFGPVVFAVNLPFYLLGVRALGWAFTARTFIAVGLLSVYSEVLPMLVALESLNRVFAAVMGGFLVGLGLLILIRHRASLGGISIVAIYLQQRLQWRAGIVQGAADVVILGAGVFARDPVSVALSVLGALALNLVIAVNHRTGRYMGV